MVHDLFMTLGIPTITMCHDIRWKRGVRYQFQDVMIFNYATIITEHFLVQYIHLWPCVNRLSRFHFVTETLSVVKSLFLTWKLLIVNISFVKAKRLNSTQLDKISASEHVLNSCELVAVNNTKHDITDLLDADWLEFMQLGHNITVCASCEEVVSRLLAVLGQYVSKRLNSTKPSSWVELSWFS